MRPHALRGRRAAILMSAAAAILMRLRETQIRSRAAILMSAAAAILMRLRETQIRRHQATQTAFFVFLSCTKDTDRTAHGCEKKAVDLITEHLGQRQNTKIFEGTTPVANGKLNKYA